MLIFTFEDYADMMQTYIQQYKKQLRVAMLSSKSSDIGYFDDMISKYDSFACVISKSALLDAELFQNELKLAAMLQESNESFEHYCYDSLKNCLQNTNECIVCHNNLITELTKTFQDNTLQIAVATDYVGFNTFKRSNIVLTNFKKLPAIGLSFAIASAVKQHQSTLIAEISDNSFEELLALQPIYEQLQKDSILYQLLENWYDTYIKFDIAKADAKLAWFHTYAAYAKQWYKPAFIKQAKYIYCSLTVNNAKSELSIDEQLTFKGRNRKICFGNDINKVIELDYFNSANVQFND